MIMSFCEKFQRAVGDTTIYRLSKITGIERTKLQRIKSGQKLPTRDELELICVSLYLSPEEKFNLTKEYEIAIIGEDRYKSRICTANFIENLYNIFEVKHSPVERSFKVSLNIECPVVLKGESDTYNMIDTILRHEAVENNTIYMYGDVFDNKSHLNNLLKNVTDVSGLSVYQIFGLKPYDESYDNYYSNINMISKIYPIFLSKTDYHAYYYYDKTRNSSILPYFIVTDNYLITISYDKRSAVIIQDENIIKLHKELFEQKINDSYALIADINTLMGYSSIYVEHLQHFDIANTNLITIEYEPCVTPYIGDELIEMCMRKDIPNFPVIFDRAKSCLSQYRDFMLKTSIFTERGLDNFIMTGRITEIPEIAYNPIPPKYRIKILNELCKSATELKQSSLHLIREDKLHLPKNLRYCGTGQVNDFFLLLSDVKNSHSIFKLNECGFAKPFYDFASSLIDSDTVYSNAETVKIIQDKILKFSQFLKSDK